MGLVICPHCKRHFRHTAESCPFCAARPPALALAAAALVAAQALGACRGPVAVYGGPPTDNDPADVAVYGPPPADSPSAEAVPSASPDPAESAPVGEAYGPPPQDEPEPEATPPADPRGTVAVYGPPPK